MSGVLSGPRAAALRRHGPGAAQLGPSQHQTPSQVISAVQYSTVQYSTVQYTSALVKDDYCDRRMNIASKRMILIIRRMIIAMGLR